MIKRLTIAALTFFTGIAIAAQDDALVPAAELADETGAFIDVNGTEIYYIDEGSTDGPAVLLLHGFGGATVTWDNTIPALVDAGYRAVAYDRPPFGLSDKSPDIDYSYAAQVEYATGLMDELGIESAILVGHSQGGSIITQIAAAAPERVDGLVFAAGAVDGVSENMPLEDNPMPTTGDNGLAPLFELINGIDPANPFAQNLLQNFLSAGQFADILTSTYFDPADATDERRMAYSRALRVEGWPAGFLAYLTDVTERDPVDLDALAAQDWPVLILWGEDDTWVPLEQGEWLSRVFPDAEFITYPETGHIPMEEEAEQFNADLLNFLATVDNN